jgi:excisionase family DNA binding protein
LIRSDESLGAHLVAEDVMKDRALYSIEEARERLGGISRNTLYQMLRKGELASVILGCRRFIAADAIAKLTSIDYHQQPGHGLHS